AKNEITFRFWSSGNRFIDKSNFYVDEQVRQDIVAQVFERNTTETFAAPRDNQIQWFKLDAVVGDSLSFVANKACTMQLFAPSGEEVFNVSGPESITLYGLHAWEDGTYYLAVHDMTGSGDNLSVTYQWIGKYCVLAYTPDKIGNRVGNRFVIDLIGNGFNYLEDVMLTRESDTLFMTSILSAAKSTAKILFVIADPVSNGKYDFYLTYRDGDEIETISYSQALELEEPDPGEKLVTITTPARTANPYPVRVTIENTGNLDYVYVPFNIAFTWPTNSYVPEETWIDQIDFADFCATMTHEADSVGYSFAHVTTNLLGTGKDGGIMFFGIPYLKAHETRSFTLDFTAPAHIRFDLYAWVGDGYEYNLDFDTLVYHENRANPRAQNLLDFGEAAEEAGGYLGDVGDYIGGAASHIGGAANTAGQVGNTAIKTGVAFAGIYNAIGHIQDKAALENAGIDPSDPLYEDIMNLHPPIATPGEIMGGWAGEMLDRIMGFQRTCGDLPDPNPGTPCHVFLCHPGDPNEMHGYLSESESHYMTQEIQTLGYEIEFENDTTLASAAAHTIIVRDTLDATKFDLNSLAARSVTIGDKRLELNGEQTFARTLDLRPEMYVIAQIEQDYDPTTGIVEWTIQSLDPMTMEPTDDPNQGVLPVNYNGNGVGFIDYSIDLKEAFADGTEISNRAGIIFDQNEVIMTPTWTNTVDAVKPTSHIEEVTPVADSLSFSFVSEDNRSGVWYHSLYYRNDSTDMQWQVKKPQITENSLMLFFDDFQTTEYLVMAVDSAGNIEEKEMVAEYTYYYEGPGPASQTNSLTQGWNWWSTYVEMNNVDGLGMLQNSLGHNGLTIKSQNDFTDNYYQDMGEDYWYGSLESIQNEQGYLINVADACSVTMTGSAAIPALHPITIQPNWNWIGYPVAVPQTVASALAGFNPMPDDVVKGQSDFTSYYEGFGWYPDDFMLVPGQSYLYFSNANAGKTLTYASGSRGGALKSRKLGATYWNNNVHAFADNLSVMAVVKVDSVEQRDEHLELGAFVNGECRGSVRLRYFAPLDRYYAMLTVSGQDGDLVGFRLIHSESLEENETCGNHLVFSKNAIVGSLGKPYEVRFGEAEDAMVDMVLYPNPVERGATFSLMIPSGETVTEVLITDVVGNQLRHETGAIDANSIKGLPTAGVYVIKAVAKSGNTYHGRLIVE
ncbi:MAG: T9SS type A sorting domain-containing protein, partial [Bacteroidales bacterium]|nr:T9SS type A sorting domain-containing protein [Bacteroidales bacterium]